MLKNWIMYDNLDNLMREQSKADEFSCMTGFQANQKLKCIDFHQGHVE